jgi:hypothetical protein
MENPTGLKKFANRTQNVQLKKKFRRASDKRQNPETCKWDKIAWKCSNRSKRTTFFRQSVYSGNFPAGATKNVRFMVKPPVQWWLKELISFLKPYTITYSEKWFTENENLIWSFLDLSIETSLLPFNTCHSGVDSGLLRSCNKNPYSVVNLIVFPTGRNSSSILTTSLWE